MILKNQIIERGNLKPIVYDLYYKTNQKQKPLVIFCHGYKGFKDWGAWHLVAEAFMKANCFFIKFNFSHNGGTVKTPIDFPDLEAFGNNNYTKELEDLKAVIEFAINSNHNFKNEIDVNNITLIGHSRGGGISILKAYEDPRIKRLITWAAVSDFGSRFGTDEEIKEWKKTGVKTVLNGRTKQKMPHYYQFYEDFIAHKNRLDIERATKNLKIPQLIIHANNDTAVNFTEALHLHSWNPDSKLLPIENSSHVFGAVHPWEEDELPKVLNHVVEASLEFVNT
jgi:pimeloyl-ACP methyl ester carboxylesterase